MTSPEQLEPLPPPCSEDVFEDMVRDVLAAKYNSSHLSRLGRRGQRQHGIDGFDPHALDSLVWQATLQKTKLLEKLKSDLDLMDREWIGAPSEFIFAVSTRRDSGLQKQAAKISQERRESEKCPVTILFWDQLCPALIRDPDLRAKYYGRLFLHVEKPELPADAIQEYLYFDDARISMYFEQLHIPTGEPAAFPSRHDQLTAIRTRFQRMGWVNTARPVEMRHQDSGRRLFTEESMIARKVIIPPHQTNQVPGLKSLAVWVSDPNPNDIAPFRGTFLYLVEAYWDGGAYATVYSGCSALQAIANIAAGRDNIFRNSTGSCRLGRDSYEHPIEKLRELGGMVGQDRSIRSLYRERYLTDEQGHTHNGENYRVNDLLAYPLYIIEE